MGLYADVWLRQARDGIGGSPQRNTEMSPADFERVAAAVEKAIKAALVESHGSIPQQHNHAKLVAICQATGVWDVLPPALKSLVREVEQYKSADQPGFTGSGGVSSQPADIVKYFTAARRLIDYMEYHVIGNDSILKRLTVT